MKRIVIFLLLLCFCLTGRPDDAHAHALRSEDLAAGVKHLHRVQPFTGAGPQYRVKTPVDKDGESLFAATTDNDDENDLLQKYTLLVRYVVTFFYITLQQAEDSGLPHRLLFRQHQAAADSPRYIRLRVLRL